MEQHKRSLLIPQYFKNFTCIGSDCEDSCCIGWRVDIDHNTYKKYRSLKDSKLTPLIKKSISRNRSGNNESTYAKINLEEGCCPFLDDKKLCKIQLEKGHTYLSNVCTVYPRMTNSIDGTLEKSLTMSCPQAVRIALLNPQPMEFDECDESVDTTNMILHKFNVNDINMLPKGSKYFWDLRIFTISILQNRDYEIWERLIILGLFTKEVQEVIDNNKINNIPEVIELYSSHIEKGIFKQGLKEIPTESFIQMKLLKEIADIKILSGINNGRYKECFLEFLNGINYDDGVKIEEIEERYTSAYENYYSPFINQHDYILENYLVNHVFKNAFPLTNSKSMFNAYMMLVLHYSLIKMHLVGISAYNKGLTVELVVKLIQSFAKNVEHSPTYLKNIEDLMESNGFNTMAYMSILLKN